jgi:hypothetical protein
MKKIMILVIVFSLLFPSGALFAKERQGAQLVITKTDGTKIEGELIAIKQNSTLLFESSSGISGSIDVSEVKSIKIVKGSLTGVGIFLGILTGGIAGGSLGYGRPNPNSGGARFVAAFGALAGVAVGVLAGGILGGVIGSCFHATDEFPIEGKSQEKIRAYLEELRSEARFPDYQ